MTTSVVLPAKNEELVIEDCLRSLLRQTVLPEEVIVVDNNSTDNTAAIVESLVEEFETVGVTLRYFLVEQGNQIEARSKGFGEVISDITISIDADTRLKANWIAETIRFFERHPKVVATGGIMIYDRLFASIAYIFSLILLGYLFRTHYYFYGSNAAFRTDAYNESGGLEGNRKVMEEWNLQEPYDDLWVSTRLSKLGTVRLNPRLICRGLFRENTVVIEGKHRSLMTQFVESYRVQKFIRTHASVAPDKTR